MFWRNKILLFIYKLNAVLAILSIAGFNILYLILQASGISGYEFNILKHEIGGLFPLSLLFILLAFTMLPAIWLLKIRLSLLFKLLPVFALVYWIVVFLLDPGGVFYWYAGD